jgi:hypothetical protein
VLLFRKDGQPQLLELVHYPDRWTGAFPDIGSWFIFTH